MRVTYNRILLFVIGGMILLSFGLGENGLPNDKIRPDQFPRQAAVLSKAEIVAQIATIGAQIQAYEKANGTLGKTGFKIYSPAETTRLVSLYQEINLRVQYLEQGQLDPMALKLDGYTFETGKVVLNYNKEEVQRAIADLGQADLPVSFLNQLHIFLSPYAVQNISGLGGAGYIIIPAQPPAIGISEEQLKVTLYHEIGHSVHLRFMSEEQTVGQNLWQQYLNLRGGVWHDGGTVNTSAWSQSSEETFAEDFRLLFGKQQPFYNDIALGDPRIDKEQASQLKQFITRLPQENGALKYQSPWVPWSEMTFWLWQPAVIVILWVLLGLGLGLGQLQNGLILKRQSMQMNNI